MTAPEVAAALGNKFNAPWLCTTNPYRIVFLDGCSTASGRDWRQAFGILPIWAAQQAARPQLGPQAYVGWAGIESAWLDSVPGYVVTVGTDLAVAYTETLQRFYLDWMNGASLFQCIIDVTNNVNVDCPLPVYAVKTIVIVNVTINNKYPSRIYVIGHSGLTVSGLNSGDDHKFEAPVNIQ
jgi:hypothetical protein